MKTFYIIIAILALAVIISIVWGINRKNSKISEFFPVEGEARLSKAVASGDVEKIKKIVGEGVNPNAVGDRGITQMYVAVIANQYESVKTLIELGVDPRKFTEKANPLYATNSLKDDTKILELLLANGADPNLITDDGYNTIGGAIISSNDMVMEKLLESGVSVDSVIAGNGFTIILGYSGTGNWAQVKKMIDRGANHNIYSKGGGTVAWNAYQSFIRGVYKEGSKTQLDLEEVINLLKSKGVKFPPETPEQIRVKNNLP